MSYGTVPHAVESERYVLGAMLQDPDAVETATGCLKADDFYEPRHQQIFRVMQELAASREQFDAPTIARALEERRLLEPVGGYSYLLDLIDTAYATANVDFHARAVRDASVRRHLIVIAQDILHTANETTSAVQDVLDRAEQAVFNLGTRGETGGFRRLADLMEDVNEEIRLALERQSSLRGLDTGYRELNQLLSGLQAGDLIILAARPSVGKTAFGLNLARNVGVGAACPVAIFSLEMSCVQLAMRLLSQEANVNLHEIMQGSISSGEQQRLSTAMSVLRQAPIYIDDQSPLTVVEMVARCRRLASRLHAEGKTLGLVVVDYLQLMRPTEAKEQRRLEVAEFSRGLKRMARQLSVPVLACCQLSRAAEKDKGKKGRRPQLADLYESDAIGQDADVVMFLHNLEEAPDEDGEREHDRLSQAPLVEVVIGKHRNGPTGAVKLLFRKACGRFDMVAPDYLEERETLAGLGSSFDEPPFL